VQTCGGSAGGQPYDELTKYAVVNEMDLVVLGLRGHGLMETMFMDQRRIGLFDRPPAVLSVQPTTWV